VASGPFSRFHLRKAARNSRVSLTGLGSFVRQSIAVEGAFYQAATHALLKLGNAALHRGLIDAEGLGSCLHAARAREREEMPEIVPYEGAHGRSMQ
jgi:hypothetical protein